MLGALCAIVEESGFPKIQTTKQNANTGRLGSPPSLPAVRLTINQRIFGRVSVRQNAQGEGNPEVRF